ncbi:MAG: hypothetical protein L0Z49_04035 [Actinobacteria bacterium]|nr:hypothetical protein [Actinomycetota bacterium]
MGGLWPEGILAAGDAFVAEDGSIEMKFGWWLIAEGDLEITGRRLDGPATPLDATISQDGATQGFVASIVTFPIEGCWEVTGRVGANTLTFVTFVIRAT